jgi:hypothetical protein
MRPSQKSTTGVASPLSQVVNFPVPKQRHGTTPLPQDAIRKSMRLKRHYDGLILQYQTTLSSIESHEKETIRESVLCCELSIATIPLSHTFLRTIRANT